MAVTPAKDSAWPPALPASMPQPLYGTPGVEEYMGLSVGDTFRVRGEGRTKFRFKYAYPELDEVWCHELYRGHYAQWRCFKGARIKVTSTEVVNVRSDDYDVYIGRSVGRRVDVGWSNPFKMDGGKEEYRPLVVEKFRQWVQTSDQARAVWIRAHVHELKGKRLGCWCKPKECHGDVLKEMADQQ